MKKIINKYLCIIALCFLTSCGQQSSIPSNHSESTSVSASQKISIVERIKENPKLSVQDRIDLYQKLKLESFDQYDFSNEDELTMFGYSYLWSDMVDEAIKIFKLIVQEFPESANAYDSLGEAYLQHGQKKKALANYEKSFSMNPNNFIAEDQIMLLKFPDTKFETNAEKFEKVYSIQEYQDDLEQLGNRLLEVHPNALKFISEEDFWNIIKEKQDQITAKTTFSQFRWHCNEIIASLNCSHTSSGDFYFEDEMLPVPLRVPVIVRWVDQQLFITDPLKNNDLVSAKDEILSINGIKVANIISGIYKHIPSQGYIETTKKHTFNQLSSVLIPFALDFPETYNLEIKDHSDVVTLKKAESYLPPVKDSSIKRCKDDLCLDFEEDVAIMTISTFNYYPWNNLTVFQEFIDSSFKQISNKGITDLVIDLRFNGGGSMESSIFLLRYLADKTFSYHTHIDSKGEDKELDKLNITPFENRYKGNVFFIIDGIGNSTTGHFMSIAKALKLGTIVGEELGSNHFCSAGQEVCRLKNTRLVYYVANNTHVSMTSSDNDETGVLPDYYVTQSIDEYLKRKDAVKAFTLNLIKK
ncbi:S41 family peptidase [Portibacter lacus]|uniref:Tail specific protease domain-containing protein n=1 Tax=Portibacter lacus TaxID=1099794 RepID=A0AA37SSP7_9BACT|nr:S41 family peptidase [Portibacter lacus]GLR17463.1 hypothetical protein GCM10007940_20780 [Portibacter lacus]